MPIEITMPRLSDTMEQGTIVKWHVAQGDTVESGDVIADVETDKATMEMQAYDDGTITNINVSEGQPVAIGTVVAMMVEEGEDVDAAADAPAAEPAAPVQEPPADEPTPAADPAPEVIEQPVATAPAARTRAGHVRISPVARRLAEEHGVDVSSLQGSGPLGRIVKRDVLAAVGAVRETAASVPPSATSNSPSLLLTAPVNDPFMCPNSSDSSRFEGIAAQLTATKGASARPLSS